MNWTELLTACQLDNVEVTIINPIRKSLHDEYKHGMMIGYKAGLIGGGFKVEKRDGEIRGQHYSSTKRRWLKKPKVLVEYNVFNYGGRTHTDWIEVDNCTFEIKKGE